MGNTGHLDCLVWRYSLKIETQGWNWVFIIVKHVPDNELKYYLNITGPFLHEDGYPQHFILLVAEQTGKKLKCIQSDNGGEYIGPFDAYCREHGIQHQKTPPRTTAIEWLVRDGRIETLVERVRYVCFHRQGCPAFFLGDALEYGVHVEREVRLRVVDFIRVCSGDKEITQDVRWSDKLPIEQDLSKSLGYERLGARKQILGHSIFTVDRGDQLIRGVVSRFPSQSCNQAMEAVKWIFDISRGVVFIAIRSNCVALSTTEAEYVAATEACKELLRLKSFCKNLVSSTTLLRILCDNQIHMDDNASDMLTKAVAREKLKICCSIAGMANSSS
ncbi:retrovirus-related pol polyprotein from transposon TNT 1-94 [Tanacetum coccineum]